MKTDFALQVVARQKAGGGWRAFGRIAGEPVEADRPLITFHHDGAETVYWLGHGQSADDLARWFAAATGGMTMMYPVKAGERLYELTDSLGDPPADLLEDGREAELDAWYDSREAALLAGTA